MMLCKRKGMERKRKGRGKGEGPLASNSRRGEETGGASTRWKAIFGPAVCQIGTMWEEGHGHSNCNVEEPTRILNGDLLKIHMKCLRARELRARGKKGKLVDYPSAGPHKRERSGTPRVAK